MLCPGCGRRCDGEFNENPTGLGQSHSGPLALRAPLRKPDVAEHPLWRGLWRDFFSFPEIPYPATNWNGEGGIRTPARRIASNIAKLPVSTGR